MINSRFELILEQFRMYFPTLYDRATDWWKSGPYHVTALLDDNSRVEFDSSDNTIRWVNAIDRSVDSDIFRREIGRNIKKFMIYRGVSQQDLVEKVGVTQSMMSRYINGTSMPGVDKLHNIASVLGCHIDDLLGIEE